MRHCIRCEVPTETGCPECKQAFCPGHLRLVRKPQEPPCCYLCASMLEGAAESSLYGTFRQAIVDWQTYAIMPERSRTALMGILDRFNAPGGAPEANPHSVIVSPVDESKG